MSGALRVAFGVLGALAFFGLLYWLNSHDEVQTKTHFDYSETIIDYKDHPLYCVSRDHGLSCDWQRWHEETNR